MVNKLFVNYIHIRKTKGATSLNDLAPPYQYHCNKCRILPEFAIYIRAFDPPSRNTPPIPTPKQILRLYNQHIPNISASSYNCTILRHKSNTIGRFPQNCLLKNINNFRELSTRRRHCSNTAHAITPIRNHVSPTHTLQAPQESPYGPTPQATPLEPTDAPKPIPQQPPCLYNYPCGRK